MKKFVHLATISLLTGSLVACSSGSNNDPVTVAETTTGGSTTGISEDGATTSGSSTAGDGSTTADSSTAGEGTTTTDSSTAGEGTTTADSGTTGEGTTTSDGGTTSEGTTTSDGSTTGEDNTGSGNTPSGTSSLGSPPTLLDPNALPIPSPDSSDPFGSELEIDTEEAVAGGAPTTPKNLRIDLVSNDWAEINWAPSNDDVGVAEYRIYRSDDTIYTIRPDVVDTNTALVAEADKYWRTTSFIDCNYTRFSDRIHNCDINGPSPGDTFSYQVTAVDTDGQESGRSNTITIAYHKESNAAVPRYDDFYKHPDDTFAQDHDLSQTAYFMDKFTQVFNEDFTGSQIDSSKWHTGLTWGDTKIINGEQQYFVNTQDQPGFGYDPFKFTGETLIIEAVETPAEFADSLPPVCEEEDPFGKERCLYLSGALSSHDKFGMTYGYVESRMKVGGDPGMLSSFYLYHRYPGTGKQYHAPEIDIIEYLGENPFGDEDAFQTYHFADVNDQSIRSAPTMSYKNPTGEKYDEDFHTFGVLWEPQLVIWYIDGKEIKRLSGPQVARQQMNIVTYLVAGSAWAPTPPADSVFPLQFEIDYIRAYQRPEYNGNGLYPDQ